ncbi:septum formation initiator family protein [Pacificimonas sp. WHA3]|uniref:Septum formation initiator family protein n=1 Tax=Pacificimonas pallii TaxID=2827236 RepID=A0ABS6SDW1_9SPHN|nr:septum formation initiator family protein [Pacificimonas pallii]MBV7256536.1 septum formation initiator family protein [Pacificimonas pallii]
MRISDAFRETWESHVRPVLAPSLFLVVLAFFGWHSLAGDTGLLALGGYKEKQAQLEIEAAALAEERAQLEHKLSLLGDRVEADYGEELVRQKLGLIHDDEMIVRLKD